jgi:hypothetical protein
VTRTSFFPILGVAMMCLGVVTLLVSGAWPLWGSSLPGDVPAVGLVLILFGFVCNNPAMLRDDTASVSSMRVVVFGLFSVFAVLSVKAGWSATKLGDLSVSPGWAALLAAALGGKAAQAFAEPSRNTASTDAPPPPPAKQ